MFVYKLNIKIFLLKEIPYDRSLVSIASFLDKQLLEDEEWGELHRQKNYKPYSFSNLWPVEQDGVYKKERVYTFTIRTLNSRLAEYFENGLSNHNTADMKGLVVNISILPEKPIKTLYTLTPAIIKTETGSYWKDCLSLVEYKDRMKVNLIKKYNYFEQKKADEEFALCTLFELTNKKPIMTCYKNNVRLLGDKFQIEIESNETAQSMAYLALATGLCEMNSRGYGFVGYKLYT